MTCSSMQPRIRIRYHFGPPVPTPVPAPVAVPAPTPVPTPVAVPTTAPAPIAAPAVEPTTVRKSPETKGYTVEVEVRPSVAEIDLDDNVVPAPTPAFTAAVSPPPLVIAQDCILGDEESHMEVIPQSAEPKITEDPEPDTKKEQIERHDSPIPEPSVPPIEDDGADHSLLPPAPVSTLVPNQVVEVLCEPVFAESRITKKPEPPDDSTKPVDDTKDDH
ncbi:hypothetical protein K440DRAFT_638131 [Wilcoxina mikolae CBS 423.85]|nr:hypothetical protein K440DRAFT_638131 [Wilcoxina mikolae CBS 423.85]